MRRRREGLPTTASMLVSEPRPCPWFGSTGRHSQGRPGPERLHFLHSLCLEDDGGHPEYFIQEDVKNYCSVSISGYHRGGRSESDLPVGPLANGFTYVENYLARGMEIDDFAPNLSFFSPMVWTGVHRDRSGCPTHLGHHHASRYGASERSQKLKYHIQTSGRSLHARDPVQRRSNALRHCWRWDNCNSLHTNAYDEPSPRRPKSPFAGPWRFN